MFKILLCCLSLGTTLLLQAQQLDRTGALKDFQLSAVSLPSLASTVTPAGADCFHRMPNGPLLYARPVVKRHRLPYQLDYWSLTVLDTHLKVVREHPIPFKELLGTPNIYDLTFKNLGTKTYLIVKFMSKEPPIANLGCLEVDGNGNLLPVKIVVFGVKEDYPTAGQQFGYELVGDKLVTYSVLYGKGQHDCDIRLYDADLKLLQQKKFFSKESWSGSQYLLDAEQNLYLLRFSGQVEAVRARETSKGVQYNVKKTNPYAALQLCRVDEDKFTPLVVDWKYLPHHFQVVSKPFSNELIVVGAYSNSPNWDPVAKHWYYWDSYETRSDEASGLFYLRLDLPSAKVLKVTYEPFSEKVHKFENPNGTPEEIKKGLGVRLNNIQFIEIKEHLVVATTFEEGMEVEATRSLSREFSSVSPYAFYECYSIGITIFDKSGKMVSQQVIPRSLKTTDYAYASFKLLKHQNEIVLIYNDHPKNRFPIPQTQKEVKQGNATAPFSFVETRWTAMNLSGTLTHSPMFDAKGASYAWRTNHTWGNDTNPLWSIVRRANLLGDLYLTKIQK